MRIGTGALTILLLTWAVDAQAQSRRFELNDLGREVTVSGVRVAPDGRQVSAILTRTNYTDNRFERSLILIDAATGTSRELAPGRRNIGSAEWSPSGDRLAFLDREEGKQTQLYVLPLSGGEARRVTSVKQGVSSYVWRPDGQSFALLIRDEAPERTGEERHNKSFEVGNSSFLDQSATLSTHLWTIPVDGGAAQRITSGERHVASVSWTPDGRRVVLGVWPKPHSGEAINGTMVIRDIESGAERTVSDRKGFGVAGFVSPDGKWVAWGASRGPEIGFRVSGALVAPLEGGEARDVTASLDRNFGGIQWTPDSRAIVGTGPDLTRYRVWVQPLDGKIQQLELGNVDASGLTISRSGAFAFVGREPNRPDEIYYAASLTAAPKRLTDLNREFAGIETGRIETITWQGPDGFTQNGVLTYPPGYTAGRKYPLVLSIHGGPMGTSAEGWSAPNQLLAAQGWIVFSPNYRGSNNMGDKFQSAVVNDAGEGPGRDVMSGVEALKQRGLIDESKMAVSGWSYGGYMTAWLTAHYQVWKAAVAGAAVTDWFDWYTLADMNTWSGFGLGGSPWLNDNAANYWRQSPMAYAHQIRTPTLILSTTGDPRVTVTQSYKLYYALKDNNTPVQFIAYPTGGHFPPDPVHQRDVRKRWMEWIAQQFGPTT